MSPDAAEPPVRRRITEGIETERIAMSQEARTVSAQAESMADDLGSRVKDAAAKAGDLKAGVKDLKADASELTGLASDIASTAVNHGKQLIDAARGQATGFLDQRKNDTAQSISDLASSLRDSGKTFEDRPNILAFMGSAADGLEQLADGIRDRSFAEIYADAEDFARRKPLVVGAATLAAGFLLARFIKSSADELAETASRTAAARTTTVRKRDSASTNV